MLISYAHLDDQALAEGERGWIANLHRALESAPRSAAGETAADLVATRSCRATMCSASKQLVERLAARRRPRLGDIAPYLESEWCQRELNEFVKATGGGRVGDKSRVFKVMKSPCRRERKPPPLQALLGYEFYTVRCRNRTLRELNEVVRADTERDYWMKLDDLAHDIADLLRILERASPPRSSRAVKERSSIWRRQPRTWDQRDAINRALAGSRIRRPARSAAADRRRRVRRLRARATRPQPVLGAYGRSGLRSGARRRHRLDRRPPTTGGRRRRRTWPSPASDLDAAQSHGRRSRQQAFIDRLKSESGNVTKVIETPLEDFKAQPLGFSWREMSRSERAEHTHVATPQTGDDGDTAAPCLSGLRSASDFEATAALARAPVPPGVRWC